MLELLFERFICVEFFLVNRHYTFELVQNMFLHSLVICAPFLRAQLFALSNAVFIHFTEIPRL